MTIIQLAIEATGWVGALMILFSYLMLSAGKWRPQSLVYQGFNLAGALGVIVNSSHHGAFPSMTLNILWGFIGLFALARVIRWDPLSEAEPQAEGVSVPAQGEPKVAGRKAEIRADRKRRRLVADNSQSVRAERSRTLDQVKRLYAVVMGFAATECIKNVIRCINSADDRLLAQYIFISFALIFVSLMVVLFLGAERYLDKRYLSEDSPPVTQISIGWDIVNLIAISSWFVVIAQSFPSDHDLKNLNMVTLIHGGKFVWNVIILIALDVFFLLVQVCRFAELMPDSESKSNMTYAHAMWVYINFISIFVVFSVIYKNALSYGAYELSTLFFAIFLVRLLIDFGLTFKFYFPVGNQHRDDS